MVFFKQKIRTSYVHPVLVSDHFLLPLLPCNSSLAPCDCWFTSLILEKLVDSTNGDLMEKMIFPSVSIFYAVKQELLDLTVHVTSIFNKYICTKFLRWLGTGVMYALFISWTPKCAFMLKALGRLLLWKSNPPAHLSLPVLCLNWCGMMLIFYIFKVKLNMVGYKLELCYLVIYKILLYAVPSMAHLDP